MTSSPDWLVRPRYPALDGFRGAAAAAVFMIHFGTNYLGLGWTSFGWVGVDFFFVLSGFLITGGLVDTLGSEGAVRAFYTKRILRIFPLYYAFWAIVLLCHWPFHLVEFQHNLWHWPVYLGNLFSRHHPEALFSISRLNFLHGRFPVQINHFWSLCVEEQFYMFWPCLLLLVTSRTGRLALCLFGVITSLVARCWIWWHGPFALSHSEWAYHQTFTRFDGLLLGAVIAVLIRGPGIGESPFRWLRAAVVIVPAAIVAAYTIHAYRVCVQNNFAFTVNLSSQWNVTFALTIIPLLATGILLCCLTDGNPVSRFFQFKPLRALGTVSYGFYIIHDLPETIFVQWIPVSHGRLLATSVAVAWFFATWGLAWLSFRFFERPFLRLKDHFVPHAGAVR